MLPQASLRLPLSRRHLVSYHIAASLSIGRGRIHRNFSVFAHIPRAGAAPVRGRAGGLSGLPANLPRGAMPRRGGRAFPDPRGARRARSGRKAPERCRQIPPGAFASGSIPRAARAESIPCAHSPCDHLIQQNSSINNICQASL